MMTPQLRFPQFTDGWQVKKLGDIFDVRDGTHESPKYFDEGKPLLTSKNLRPNGILDLENVSYISQKDFESINRRSNVDTGDILFGMIGTIGNPVRVESNDFAIKNVALIKPRDNSTEYLIHYLRSPIIARQFYQKNAGGTQKFIALGDIRSLGIGIPGKPEREKITEFLTVVDGRIGKSEKKLKLLKQYKKGVMQKIFSQKTRFKDDAGKSYPDWQTKKLGEILDYEQPTKYIVRSTEYNDNHKIPVLTAGKTFILGYTNETDGIFSDLPVIIFDDFTTASHYVDFPFKVKSSAMKLLKAKDEINPKVAYELLKRIKFVADDHKRYWIGTFQDFTVSIPSEEEQQKIANVLNSLDDKIKTEETKLKVAKEWKKGLLQRMFV